MVFSTRRVLLTSGFTMALAVDFARLRKKSALLILYSITWILGALFLGIEGYEYHTKFLEHLVPGSGFHFEGSNPGALSIIF